MLFYLAQDRQYPQNHPRSSMSLTLGVVNDESDLLHPLLVTPVEIGRQRYCYESYFLVSSMLDEDMLTIAIVLWRTSHMCRMYLARHYLRV